MRKGIVTHIDPVFNKGFIEDENGQDIFFDFELMHNSINIGDSVKFQIIFGPNGLVASDVEPVIQTNNFNLDTDNTAAHSRPLECQQ
ncbi:cold shock domain-containing protein [Pedobacter sp. UBA5917]|jgi:cold shock CspA family protein|uniref:cold shock domain-containing protein n=1 Tax=Pedobacter sp. UBA5917 TaxID=1947061 RepID=UPI0025E9DB7F|nr:cold shock domain-containing protein [Pedobacter sp. UBA5917]